MTPDEFARALAADRRIWLTVKAEATALSKRLSDGESKRLAWLPLGELLMRIHSSFESVHSLLASRRSSSSERQEETKEGRISSTAEISLASSAELTLDFTQMSSREMQEIAQGMFEAGEIDLTELFMLQNAGVPLGRMGESGEFIPYSESERGAFRKMPLNYLQLAQDGMETAKLTGGETNPASGYAQWKSLYELLSGKTAGVDLLA